MYTVQTINEGLKINTSASTQVPIADFLIFVRGVIPDASFYLLKVQSECGDISYEAKILNENRGRTVLYNIQVSSEKIKGDRYKSDIIIGLSDHDASLNKIKNNPDLETVLNDFANPANRFIDVDFKQN